MLDPLGIDWRLETGTGDPASELDRIADTRHADLIVVGGRGTTPATPCWSCADRAGVHSTMVRDRGLAAPTGVRRAAAGWGI